MKIKFLLAMLLSFIFSVFFLDLSNVHSVIKIPVRALSLIAMIIPIYFTTGKYKDIKKILFKKKLDGNKVVKLLSVLVVLIIFAVLIRFITYKGNFLSFSKSLHYGKYLWMYLTFGYLLHAFLQEVLLLLLYHGMITFIISNKNTALIVVTLMFGVSHFYLGIFTVIITFTAGVVFLLIYRKFENIFALTIAHYLLGIVAIAFGWA